MGGLVSFAIGYNRAGKSTQHFEKVPSGTFVFDSKKSFTDAHVITSPLECARECLRLCGSVKPRKRIILQSDDWDRDAPLYFQSILHRGNACILVDEAFIGFGERICGKLATMIKAHVNTRNVKIFLLGHRPLDSGPSIRGLADHWCLYRTSPDYFQETNLHRVGIKYTDVPTEEFQCRYWDKSGRELTESEYFSFTRLKKVRPDKAALEALIASWEARQAEEDLDHKVHERRREEERQRKEEYVNAPPPPPPGTSPPPPDADTQGDNLFAKGLSFLLLECENQAVRLKTKGKWEINYGVDEVNRLSPYADRVLEKYASWLPKNDPLLQFFSVGVGIAVACVEKVDHEEKKERDHNPFSGARTRMDDDTIEVDYEVLN